MSEGLGFALLMLVLVAVVVSSFRLTALPRRPPGPPPRHGDAGRLRVLVLSAGVGGGHDAAARAIAAELTAAGHRVVTRDGLHQMSPSIAWLLGWGYQMLLEHVPWLYDAIFRSLAAPGVRSLVRVAAGRLYGGRLLRLIARQQPHVIVSTYPLVTAALGWLRRRGRLAVPVTAVVSDYGIHPMWIAPGVDEHLVVTAASIPAVRSIGSRAVVIRPLAGPGFQARWERAAARRALGLPETGFLALVVGGAWGIGDLVGTTAAVAGSGVQVAVVAGRNERVRARLAARFRDQPTVWVYGWTDQMPILMAAADCLVQNAGGLTCLEAIHLGLPIVIYQPIAGHGRRNARTMEQVGAACWPRSEAELNRLLRAAAAGEAPLPAPRQEISRPAAAVIVQAVAAAEPVSARSRLRGLARVGAAAVVALALFVVLASSQWGVVLAARGLRMDLPGYNPPAGVISVAVQVTTADTAHDIEVLIEREAWPVAIFTDSVGAAGLSPAAGVEFGVAEAPGSRVTRNPLRVRDDARLAAAAIQHATGEWPAYFLPARSDLNLTALAVAPRRARLVIPGHLDDGRMGPGVLVIDASGLSPAQAAARLRQALEEIQMKGLTCVPLDALSS